MTTRDTKVGEVEFGGDGFCAYCGDPGAEWRKRPNDDEVYCSDYHAAMDEARDILRGRIADSVRDMGLRLRKDPVFTQPYNDRRADHHLGVADEIRRGIHG